ncbi:MAG: hypothetical protein WA821_08510 [Anaerolineales bacterium]
MDFSSLGKRDIFGILMPGILPVLIGAYALYAALLPFQTQVSVQSSPQSPVADILGQGFLITVLIFASAYLVGSLLRLFAADAVDDESGEHLLNEWEKEHEKKNYKSVFDEIMGKFLKKHEKKDYESVFEEIMGKLLNGDDAPGIPPDFDGWLWAKDKFPYSAWLNRSWGSYGFQDILDFFQKNHKAKMWPQSHDQESPKSFFNYCKLAVIDGGGTLADEVNTAEGNTRFFAGTMVGMKLSSRVLELSIIFQAIVIIAKVAFAQRAGIDITWVLDWTTQSIHLALSFLLITALLQMCGQITKRFRTIRQKEVKTVFHAFYLYATRPYRQEEKKKKGWHNLFC